MDTKQKLLIYASEFDKILGNGLGIPEHLS